MSDMPNSGLPLQRSQPAWRLGQQTSRLGIGSQPTNTTIGPQPSQYSRQAFFPQRVYDSASHDQPIPDNNVNYSQLLLQKQQAEAAAAATAGTPRSPQVTPMDPAIAASPYWKQQVQLCQVSRSSNGGHSYARLSALTSRKGLKTGAGFAAAKPSLVEVTADLLSSNPESDSPLPADSGKAVRGPRRDDPEAEKPAGAQPGAQLWFELDLSGQKMLNLNPRLFQSYTFLTKLYLNGNRIRQVPAGVRQLRHLRVLDLSSNELTQLPPDLGMVFNLRYLYLFDNRIERIPYEFGNLFELEFLGVEGNPLDVAQLQLLAEKGTAEFIMALRDQAPEGLPPAKREWVELEEDGEKAGNGAETVAEAGAEAVAENVAETAQCFTLMSYNTLCPHYATARMYKYTPAWALDWSYRKESLKAEILEAAADIVCLQEVETQGYEEFWLPFMEEKGYNGCFNAKSRARTMSEKEAKKVDGCATFFRSDAFELLDRQLIEYSRVVMLQERFKKTDDVFNRVMNKDNIALITQLLHKPSGSKIIVANTHLYWDPAFNDVKTLQVGVLFEELKDIVEKFGRKHRVDPRRVPLVICGDFNSTTNSAVYQLFAQGKVTKHDDFQGRDYGKYTSEGFTHPFVLKSAYDSIGELPFTNFTPLFTDVIDYIWYATPALTVRGLLGEMDKEYLRHVVGFPNVHNPSDHISLMAKFQFKKPKENAGARQSTPEYSSRHSTRKT